MSEVRTLADQLASWARDLRETAVGMPIGREAWVQRAELLEAAVVQLRAAGRAGEGRAFICSVCGEEGRNGWCRHGHMQMPKVHYGPMPTQREEVAR